MPTIPHDNTLHLARDEHDFSPNHSRNLENELFFTRVMGKSAVCIHGAEAAALFSDDSKFARSGTLPQPAVASLSGRKTMHRLDVAGHKPLDRALPNLLTTADRQRLIDETALAWRRGIRRWQTQSKVVLLEETARVLTDAVLTWAGIPLKQARVAKRARDLELMVDGFGGAPAFPLQSKLAQARIELWLAHILSSVRRRKLQVHRHTALWVLATHRDADGQPLDLTTAAAELIGILRPTVAVAWDVTLAALALHQHPDARAKLASEPIGEGTGAFTDAFAKEVSRFYPSVPYAAARVRSRFAWKGHEFKPGALVVLDVQGTDRDPNTWTAPEEFRPERFLSWEDASDYSNGFSRPAEWIQSFNVALALHFLTRGATYEVLPDQDLTIDRTRMPTQPESGFVMHNVRATDLLDRPAPRPSTQREVRDLEVEFDEVVPARHLRH
jgi:fatty-acid peroxygenase